MAQMEIPSNQTLLIVWHSRTGAARQLAEAALEGAHYALNELEAQHKVNVLMRHATDTEPDHLLKAQAYIFCAPENLGSLSGAMKEFFDRCYYGVLDQLNGRPYGVLISAGSDGSGATRQIERIATGWRLRLIAPPYIANTDAQTAEAILAEKTLTAQQREPAWTLGATLAALLV